MEPGNQNAARDLSEKDWFGPSAKMQGSRPPMMSPQLHSNNSSFISNSSFYFAGLKDHIRPGLSRCMSHSSAHLKDEVRVPAGPI